MLEWRFWIGIGALMAALSVGLGAFGAHALKGTLNEQQSQLFRTAFEYHLIHSLALLAVGLFASRINSGLIQMTGWLFCAGIILFSGSLYLMAIGLPRSLGFITPLGGLAFIAAWIIFAFQAFKPL
jgi:uncharacterized membrane protein YgdD (TMEM256/DUF423 family)